jgi:hypothetical protein
MLAGYAYLLLLMHHRSSLAGQPLLKIHQVPLRVGKKFGAMGRSSCVDGMT